MATVASTDDLAKQVQRLEDELRTAELACITPADQHAAELCDQLRKKKAEFDTAAAAEAVAADKQRRAQDLETLRAIENDQRETHSLLVALRAESVNLAQRLVLTEHRHNELLRIRGELKKKLGM